MDGNDPKVTAAGTWPTTTIPRISTEALSRWEMCWGILVVVMVSGLQLTSDRPNNAGTPMAGALKGNWPLVLIHWELTSPQNNAISRCFGIIPMYLDRFFLNWTWRDTEELEMSGKGNQTSHNSLCHFYEPSLLGLGWGMDPTVDVGDTNTRLEETRTEKLPWE